MQNTKTKKTRVEAEMHPLDAVMNRLTGANNARAIITWLATQTEELPQVDTPAGTARYIPVKGL